ncbi:MAG: family 10 glycosylhydrolase [Bacteroidetes bacterium]|nr:family 10 glycosylhydrolase [Bacteroidota bacterium]
MKKLFRIVAVFVFISFVECSLVYPQAPKHEFRGVWVASVANIDWPSKSTLTVDEQQAEFKKLIALHRANGMNSLIVQVRPCADALYPSRYEPWSKWLTGKTGQSPLPYYDPLKFMVDEAHAHGLEFHAWFNPYRAAMDVDKKGIDSSSLVFKNPSWFLKYGSNYYFDPGLPQARKHVIDVILEVVNQYDIDGVHFDDYFYPYKIKGLEFPDSASFALYGKKFTDLSDWRRNNVNLLIKALSDSIRAVKPHVQFGISPFAVWRNQDKDSTGSATKAGQTCYDDLYADVLKWQKEKWVDYVIPQIYWSIGFEVANYKIIAEWWNKNSYGVPVYVGQAVYRINGTTKDERWKEPNQMPQQIRLNRSLKNIYGSAFFSSKSFIANPLGFNDSLQSKLYRTLALPIETRKRNLNAVRNYSLQFIAHAEGIQLLWREQMDTVLNSHHRYVIYRFEKNNINLNEASNIIAILPALNNLAFQNFIDRTAKLGKKYRYVVTALDIYNHESEARVAYPVVKKKSYWKIFPPVTIP